MKIIAFLLIVSVCFGSFSYISTRDYVMDKIDTINDAIDEVSGLIGDNENFRIPTANSELLKKIVYNNELADGEPSEIRDLLDYWYYSYNTNKGKIPNSDREVEVDYIADFEFDGINPYIYELRTTIYESDGKYSVVLPCVRVSNGVSEYLLIDPVQYVPVGMNSRFNVKISYGRNSLMQPVYCFVETMLIQIKGQDLYLMSMDSDWYDEYEEGLNFGNILDFFLTDRNNFVKSEPLNGYINNSLVSVEDYCEGRYIYKNKNKIS